MIENLYDLEALTTNLWQMLENFEKVADSLVGLEFEKGSNDLKKRDFGNRFIIHLFTILHLLKGTPTKSNGTKFSLDENSINTIIRATTETFLMFYFIFRMTENKEEINFRHNVWDFCDLNSIIKNSPELPKLPKSGVDLQEVVNERYEALRKAITDNRFFKELRKSEQENILKRSMIRYNTNWTEIAFHAGFNKKSFKSFYNRLCSFSHSGNYSLIHPYLPTKFRELTLQIDLVFVMIVFCLFIVEYCQINTVINQALEKNDFLMGIISFMLNKGAEKQILRRPI